MTTTTQLDPPPGMPGDDGTEDGGGPPRIAALANARFAAQNWANVSGADKYVIEHGAHVFIADDQDLAVYHSADIAAGRSTIAWVAAPAPPVVAAPDVTHAPVGWAD